MATTMRAARAMAKRAGNPHKAASNVQTFGPAVRAASGAGSLGAPVKTIGKGKRK